MAATTTPAPSANGKPAKRPRVSLGRNPTRGYRGTGGAWWGYSSAAIDGAPFFTWLDVPRMLRDPRVRFIERMWRSPFQKVKWTVKASSDAVAAFVDTTLRKFWRQSLPRLLSKYFRYGYAPGGAEFVAHRGRWRLDQVRAVEPRDASPRVWADGADAGRFAGFALASPLTGAGSGAYVGPPHAMWFGGYGELTDLHDMPVMAGMFEPWVEKRGRNGAIHSRRLWYRKCAYSGGIMYYPDGETNCGTDESPQYRDNQDLANETLDYGEAGSTYTFTNEPNAADASKYAWDFRPAEARSDVAGVREYPKDLDAEMMEGAGIPSEVFEAADVGSGWSGRLIPLLGYLGTVDELAGLVVCATEPWLRPAVRVNYGPAAWYEVETQSLADEVAQQQGKGRGAPNPIPGLFDGKPPAPPDRRPADPPLTLSTTVPDVPAKPHKYGCVYLPLSGEVADRLYKFAASIRDADLADRGREDEAHVTARLGLHSDDPAEVVALLRGVGPVKLRFGKPSMFAGAEGGKGHDVLKVDVTSPDLEELHERLGALPHTDTHDSFHAHATIGYVKAGKGVEYLRRWRADWRPALTATADTAVFSDRDRVKTTIPLATPAKELSAALPPPPVRAPALVLSWTEYTGPKGGTGWVSDTGEVRYQTERPADGEGGDGSEEGQGVESLARLDGFSHLPVQPLAEGAPTYAQLRKEFAERAAGAGLAPAELHRRAARHAHALMHWAKEDVERGTHPDVSVRGVFRQAYGRAHDELAAERVLNANAREFADSYFGHDRPVRRAAKYFKEVSEGRLDPDLLPDDTLAAVAEDLTHLPPAKLAAHVAQVYADYGAESDAAAHRIATAAARAAAGARPARPVAFDGAAPGDYMIVTPDEAGEDVYAGLRAAAALVPGVKAPVDGDRAVLVAAGTPLAKIAAGDHGVGRALDSEDAQHALFNSLASGFQLPQRDVPASARDYGGTSGSKGSGEFSPEGDWNPHGVDVYRRVNADWYLKRPADSESGEWYEWVHRDGAPPLSRLPDAYWESFDPEQEPQHDSDLEERREKREQKSSDEGAARKRDIVEWRREIAARKADVGRLRQEWQQALKGVPEDERPEEPDWAAGHIDESAITDQHDSREDHAGALEALHGDFEDHLSDLRDELDAAKEHAAEYHSENAKHTAAVEEHRAAWRSHDSGVRGHVEKLRAAHDVAQSDEDLNDNEIDAVASWYVPELEEDGQGDAKAALEGVRGAVAALGKSSSPGHDDGPDPDEYDVAEGDELPAAERFGSPADAAEHYEEAAAAHHDRLAELRDAAAPFVKAVASRSAEWRAEQAERLEAVRAAVHKALTLPAARYTDSGGDGQVVHDDLTELNKRVMAALAGVRKSVELSAAAPADLTAANAIPGRLMRQRKNVLAQLLALAMVRRQQEATESGNPQAAAGSIAALAALAGDPAQVARIVGMRGAAGAGESAPEPTELSWVEYAGPKGGKGWKNTESGKVVYQRAKPGHHAERKASAQAAREILGRIHSGAGATAADLAELPKHIPLLNREQLSNARILLEAKWGVAPGARARREQMVGALLAHVDKLAKGPATDLPGVAGNAARDAAAETAPEPAPAEPAPRGRRKRRSLFAGEAPPEPAHAATLADGSAVAFVPHPVASGGGAGGYATVEVDPKKLDAAWSKDAGYYVPPGGGGAEVPGRRDRVTEFLKTGEPLEAPYAVLSGDAVSFGDGRHRFSVLRDGGADRVAVTVPESQAGEFRKRFGAGSASGPAVGPSAGPLSARSFAGRADDAAPTDEEFAAASAKPAPSAPPAGAVPSPAMDTPAPVPPPPPPTDRGSLDSIKEATDRALGVAKPAAPEPPARGGYAAWLRAAAADPAKFADVRTLAPSPLLDRSELLAAVSEVYGPAVHAEAKKKSKQGIVDLLTGAQPSPGGAPEPPASADTSAPAPVPPPPPSGFSKPAAKERTNDKGDVLAPFGGDPATVKGGFVASGEKNYRAEIARDGSPSEESHPFQGNVYHGLVSVRNGTPRVYAAATKNGRGDVFFAAAESAGDFRDAADTLRAAGLDPAEHLPHAAAHTFGTGQRSLLSRVHEYLRDGGVEPPAPAAPAPTDRGAPDGGGSPAQAGNATGAEPRTQEEAQAAYSAHLSGPLREAARRLAAARAKLPHQPSAFDIEMGERPAEVPPQVAAEVAAATADHERHARRLRELQALIYKLPPAAAPAAGGAAPKPAPRPAPVALRGNTFAVRAELRKIPGARYNERTKKWTVPAEHAERAQKLVDGAPPSDPDWWKGLSDAELAERGFVRTSGPRGPYVRRGTPEELDDHL